MRRRDGAAAIMVAASCIAGDRLLRCSRRVAPMNRLAQTAGVRRRGQSLHRYGNKRAREREQEQNSGNQALHVMSLLRTPRLRSA